MLGRKAWSFESWKPAHVFRKLPFRGKPGANIVDKQAHCNSDLNLALRAKQELLVQGNCHCKTPAL